MKSSLLLLVSFFLLFTAQAQPSAPADAPASAASRPLALGGSWEGTLAIPGKTKACVIAIAETAGPLAAFLSIAGTQVERHRLTLTQCHDTLHFYGPLTEARYVCMRSTDGLLLVGQWQQRGFQNTLVFRLRQAAGTAAPGTRSALLALK